MSNRRFPYSKGDDVLRWMNQAFSRRTPFLTFSSRERSSYPDPEIICYHGEFVNLPGQRTGSQTTSKAGLIVAAFARS
jgi:hypothetical protein